MEPGTVQVGSSNSGCDGASLTLTAIQVALAVVAVLALVAQCWLQWWCYRVWKGRTPATVSVVLGLAVGL